MPSAIPLEADYEEHSESYTPSKMAVAYENNTDSSIPNDESKMSASSTPNISKGKINWKAIGSVISAVFGLLLVFMYLQITTYLTRKVSFLTNTGE